MSKDFLNEVETEIEIVLQENLDRKIEATPDQLSKLIGTRLREKFGGTTNYIPLARLPIHERR